MFLLKSEKDWTILIHLFQDTMLLKTKKRAFALFFFIKKNYTF